MQNRKFKKSHKRIKKVTKKFIKARAQKFKPKLTFGTFAIITQTSGYITNNQYDTIKLLINKKLKKTHKFWMKIRPTQPVSKKPTETRMGKGKGATCNWIAPLCAGATLVEFDKTIRLPQLQKLKKILQNKLTLKFKLIQEQ